MLAHLLHISTFVTCCLFPTLLTFLQNTTLKNYKEAQIRQQKFVAELQVASSIQCLLQSMQKYVVLTEILELNKVAN